MTNQQSVPATSGASTFGAGVAAIILLVPGYFAGWAASTIYMWMTNIGLNITGGGGSWIPFLNGIMAVLWYLVVPAGVLAAVTTWCAASASFWLFKKARREPVLYALCATVLLLVAVIAAVYIYSEGWTIRLFEVPALAIGGVLRAVSSYDRT